MAEGGSTYSGIEKYRETAIAFDDLIVQVGRAIALAQEGMDLHQSDFQREVARAFQEGRLRRLDITPVNAYTMPETTLYLKIGLSMRYPEGSDVPSLSAVPLNATTTNQNDIDVEASTEVRLRFVSVPQAQEPPGPAPSSLSSEEVQEIVQRDERMAPMLEELSQSTVNIDYKEDSRLWIISYLDAREARMVVLVDDRTAEVVVVIDKKLPPVEAELAPIGPPEFERIEPSTGRRGEILTVHGDNFLTLAGQTILSVDGRPIPTIRLSMKTISFKLPGWVNQGDIEIITPLGSIEKIAAFTPLPTFESFVPNRGSFDALHQRGSWFSVYGHNLCHGCTIRFATGVESKSVQILSPGQMKVEVPEDAGSGPLTLLFDEFEQSLADVFFMLPRVDQVIPRQARVGEEVSLTGNSLEGVTEVVVGDTVVSRDDFSLHIPTQIRFLVPPGASDGRIRVRETIPGSDEYSEVITRHIFYVVPRITGYGSQVGIPGSLLTIYGEGLDSDPEMMALLFDAKGGISEAPVLSVSSDRTYLTTRVPSDAVTGFVRLLRKKVYTESLQEDTSDLSLNKLTVLSVDGDQSDLILDERFDTDLSRWVQEVRIWRIDRGMLTSEQGPARLSLSDEEALKSLPRDQLTIYADVIKAERFGFSFIPYRGRTRLQVWVDLIGDKPALTWSRINSSGVLEFFQGLPLAVISGGDHLVQLNITKTRIEEKECLKLTFLLDQEVVHTYHWYILEVGNIALLADSKSQYWDNVVILKGDYLSLPDPEFYRFGSVPEPPQLPSLRVDTFEPTVGPEDTEVRIVGVGLDEASRFFFGGVEAAVVESTGIQAIVTVPTGAKTGPIEVHGRAGVITTTGDKWFVLPPKITSLVPAQVLAGQELRILGTNLPMKPATFDVQILDQPAQVVAATASMLTVLVPDVVGRGLVSFKYEGFIVEAPSMLEVRRENLLLDMIAKAENAVWTTSTGQIQFGILGEITEPSVQFRTSERMEDDRVYGPVLYVHPPAPSMRALIGIYPILKVPQGRVELRVEFGMLWSAAPAPEEIADVDGVQFEISFRLSDTGKEIVLLQRITCVHDGSTERFVLDASSISGKQGQLIISVFAGRTGLRDNAAIVGGKLIQLT